MEAAETLSPVSFYLRCKRKHSEFVDCSEAIEPCVDCGAGLKSIDRWHMEVRHIRTEKRLGVLGETGLDVEIVSPLCFACLLRRSINESRVARQAR